MSARERSPKSQASVSGVNNYLAEIDFQHISVDCAFLYMYCIYMYAQTYIHNIKRLFDWAEAAFSHKNAIWTAQDVYSIISFLLLG